MIQQKSNNRDKSILLCISFNNSRVRISKRYLFIFHYIRIPMIHALLPYATKMTE